MSEAKKSFKDDGLGGEVMRRRHKRRLGLVLVMILGAILLGIGIFGWWYVVAFQRASGKDLAYFVEVVKSSREQQLESDQGRINILLLGLDEISRSRQDSLLTDTIIVISISNEGKISLLPLPRDLWINELKTKINAIYYYGEVSDQTTGSQLAREVIEKITGLPIHYYLVVKLNTVVDVIDAIGGVQVEVEQGFVDVRYPRDNVDPTVTDPAEIYETISFAPGWQKLDGATALKFIRSRQSQTETEGSDLARSRRQQKVISAIVAKVKTLKVILNPYIVGHLYAIWQKQIRTNFTDQEVLVLAEKLSQTKIETLPFQIPVKDQENPGILIHPPDRKYGQWVYEPIDPTWSELKEFVKMSLEGVE